MIRRWLPVVLAPLLSCVQEPTIPKVGDIPITLSLTVSTRTFRWGEPDTISVTATSLFTQAATIYFNTECQIVVTIRSRSGVPVVPPNGQQTCIGRPSTLTIPAEGSVTQRVVWNGADNFAPSGSTNMLPSGTYFISAAINGLNYSTIAAAVKVDLIAP